MPAVKTESICKVKRTTCVNGKIATGDMQEVRFLFAPGGIQKNKHSQ